MKGNRGNTPDIGNLPYKDHHEFIGIPRVNIIVNLNILKLIARCQNEVLNGIHHNYPFLALVIQFPEKSFHKIPV